MKYFAIAAVVVAFGFTARGAGAVSLVEHTAGLKLLAGADVWSKPSNVPVGYEGLGFVGTAGGFAYGAAAYYELRLFKFVGLEVDLAYQHGPFHRKVTVNQIYDFTETVTTNALRLPVLAKFNVPTGFGRVWLGAGPEFTLSQSSSAKLELANGPAVTQSESTRNVKPIYGTAGLGLVLEIPLIPIEIPIELRLSKNLSQPSDYAERVALDTATSTIAIRAESSWAYRLGAGVGFKF